MATIKEIIEITSSYTVLYVEDDEKLAETVITYLSKFFKEVTYAKNGAEGLDVYRQHSFNLVFTDISMPIMDGLEMSKEIKKINNDQVIVIFSSYSDTDLFVSSADLGIDGYIIKPIDYEEFNDKLYKIAKKMKSKEHNNIDAEEIINLNNNILEKMNTIDNLGKTTEGSEKK